ncbi:aconitate hydratase AcnA [Terriglobus saanensis]|uniref:Aconitate hydratase n=1 Tax=Terriglobus saanensis (strain ATCC BAA-1853 / DSM 23119 / SP1PR4) TaxID=401053 RepID=E8V3G0_TERSS|nr:aconitate hydratase AcnA [Terriglobus saanensis]ADV83573.1 aconitate hydratase 1 [Terriglobus saanensis SP1PR4]
MNSKHPDSFQAASTLISGDQRVHFFRLHALADEGINLDRLPFALRILLENLLRCEDNRTVTAEDIRFLAHWDPKAEASREIAFMPSRVLMQDFTGIPAIVDLAAMRDAMVALGGDPNKINPLQPAELVIDHSVQVDEYGTKNAYDINTALDFHRNRERYSFLKWGQSSFDNFSVVPSGMGICHQVNLEYLAGVVFTGTPDAEGNVTVYPDTLIGTDSHTTMINGLGVLGWGAGGIEAEAAMLGQPVSMLIPQVVGFRLTGKLKEGTTATDLVLTVTELLRKHGVVGKFVEFYGPSISELPVADRATIANMAPEYGATCGLFPVDAETLRYLRLTGRTDEQIALVEAYYREQGLFYTADTPEAEYSSVIALDLGSVVSSVAGPKRPQDRVALSATASSFEHQLPGLLGPNANRSSIRQILRWEGEGGHASLEGDVTHSLGAPIEPVSPRTSVRSRFGIDPEPYLHHGSIVIAAITSCTSTSNPYIMMAAGLLAKKAVEKGLKTPPWVKTSLAPGSRVVTDYYVKSGLMQYLDALRFHVVGYGCTVCIGNAGALLTDVSQAIEDHGLVAVSVLSGNRNFEGRISPEVRANYLMSPPLVVAYALAGHIGHNFDTDPIGPDQEGAPVFLKDIWPTQAEVSEVIASSINSSMFRKQYSTISDGDQNWQRLQFPVGQTYGWESGSTYIRKAPYFEGMPSQPAPVQDLQGARILASLGDSITTDHISPAGSIKPNGPAGKYLTDHGVKPADFNSYGSRRGNHEVMVRGTFANVRLRNKLTPDTEGGVTRLLPEGMFTTIYEASVAYAQRNTPLAILAGKEYGSGSSRDWAAKGPRLLGVRFVIAESYERIHRSNLVGMGILPLQFLPGQNAESLGLTGEEIYSVGTAPGQLRDLLDTQFTSGKTITIRTESQPGIFIEFPVTVRIDTPQEILYYQHGGILQYVLRQLAARP